MHPEFYINYTILDEARMTAQGIAVNYTILPASPARLAKRVGRDEARMTKQGMLCHFARIAFFLSAGQAWFSKSDYYI